MTKNKRLDKTLIIQLQYCKWKLSAILMKSFSSYGHHCGTYECVCAMAQQVILGIGIVQLFRCACPLNWQHSWLLSESWQHHAYFLFIAFI